MRSALALLWPMALAQFGTIKIDWTQGNGFATPSLDLTPHLDDEEVLAFADEDPAMDASAESPAAEVRAPPDDASPTVVALYAASASSLRRLFLDLGGGVAPSDGDALREQTFALVAKARLKVLRRLLAERGMQCRGCLEREDFVYALVQALDAPQVAAQRMPLFVFDEPLYPHTLRRMRLYEERYKLMIERALLGDHTFGFVAPGHGLATVAHIEEWEMLDDGQSLVLVRPSPLSPRARPHPTHPPRRRPSPLTADGDRPPARLARAPARSR